MIKVAITGNIASGKSQIEQILLQKGFKVIDSDMINHDLLMHNNCVIDEIKSEFGQIVFDFNGKISKQKLGEQVFSDTKKKKQQILRKFSKIISFQKIIYLQIEKCTKYYFSYI